MNDPLPSAHLLLSTAREVETRIETALDAVGLSLAKLNVLSRLVEAGDPVPLGSLAERCSCVRSNMTQLIDRLEEEKLVERLGDPKDRRSVRAALTATGRERHAAGAKVLAEAEAEIFGRFVETDRQALARIATLVRAEG
ncbi:MAG TPA: MarR family transcriptional regulator [Thermoanaerobaculia bacterium]|jgi:DNA-binding MarR family transcriptional regulator|nr:MarR family transcriptional regulator [Thermoanaerobaculia bacterium]